MASNKASNISRNHNGFPQSMFTSRTRSALPYSMPKSSSAMSSRTYSRIRGRTPNKYGDGEVRRSMNFEDNDSSQFDQSLVDVEELENEQELLKRMIDQQKQLQELRERQKHVLQLQQQLAGMEANAELSMEEKLSKIKTAKTRLDQLQKLVTTIKSVETKNGDGDSPDKIDSKKALQVKKALAELTELKGLIGMMSGNTAGEMPQQKPAATLEPVFPNSIACIERQELPDAGYQPVLPKVSVVQYDDDAWARPRYEHQNLRKSPKRKSKDSGRVVCSPQLSPYQKRKQNVKAGKAVRTKISEKEPEIADSGKLLEEMRRHQTLLQELRERRQELEELMNLTRDSQVEVEAEEDGDDYNDTNASIRSNLGSPDDSRGVSDTDAVDFETSQSGCLFGLNESDTRRLIDLIRSQKGLGATTERTTATWGSSSSDELSENENGDESKANDNDESESQAMARTKPVKPSGNGRQDSAVGTTVRDAFTQLNYREEHEIDFRPPTRRRRNITRPELDKSASLDFDAGRFDLNGLQDNLLALNDTMHILLEDQHALTKLLTNTLNLKQTSMSGDLCYGISPDFLIYQLNNCSSQFAAILNETKGLQWQLYSIAKGCDGADKLTLGTQGPMPPVNYNLTRNHEVLYRHQGDVENFSKNAKVQSSVEQVTSSLRQASSEVKHAPVEKEETEDACAELFEALRDTIYSEAAILISQNEARPHFLIELFHSLQQLSTDFLRQHALYAIQDVKKGYIPITPRKDRGSPNNKGQEGGSMKRGSYSENTPSESAATSEEEVYAKLRAKAPEDCGYDFSLKVSSASDLSTPSEGDINPFAAEDLGSTVIHLDAALRHMREMERFKQEIQTSGGLSGSSEKSPKRIEVAQVDTEFLRAWIKNIVAEIIPVLKANHDRIIDKKLVKLMKGKVLECVAKGMTNTPRLANGAEGGDADGVAKDTDNLNLENFFSGQLQSILGDCLAKFVRQRVGACGESLVVALSEILFNELAFFYMMQDLDKEKKPPKKPENIPSIKIELDEEDIKKDSVEVDSEENEDDQDEDSEVSATEENIPGSNGEDSQDPNIKKSGETSPHPVTVDLSASETRPLTSYGSGEDEEEGSGDDYEYKEPDVPTSMQHDAVAEQEKSEGKEVQDGEEKRQLNEDKGEESKEKTEETV